MKKRHKGIVSLLATTLILATTIALSGCGKDTSNSIVTKTDDSAVQNTATNKGTEEQTATENKKSYEGVTIRVGCGTDIVKFDLGESLGYWEDEFGKDGIKVEAVRLGNGTDYVDAVSTGSVDIGIYGDQPIIAGITAGKNLKIIGRSGDDTAGYKIIVLEDSPITSIEELKGKKIAGKFGTTAQKVWIQVLKDAGLTLDDVEMINLNTSEAYTALKKGEVAATNGYSGSGANLSSYKVLKEYSDVAKSIHIISASTEFLAEYPELAARVLLVIQRTGQWINDNPEEAITKIAEIGGIDEANAKGIVESEKWNVQWEAADAQVIEFTAQWLYESDVLTKALSAKDMVDTKYLKLAGLYVGEDIDY